MNVRSRLKALVVAAGMRGFISPRLARRLIARLGLKHS